MLIHHDIAAVTQDAFPTSFRIMDYLPERRRHARRAVRATGNARRMDNTLAAQREPQFVLTVHDISEGGIAATSKVPVIAGERLAIQLHPNSGMPSRVFGRVLRCRPQRDGWFLAIRFDAIPAA